MHGSARAERGPVPGGQPPDWQAPDWQAPAAAGPVRALVRLPGSKSVTNRALVLAALAGRPATITNPLRARDTLLMAAALRTLGATIDDEGAAAGDQRAYDRGRAAGGRGRGQRGGGGEQGQPGGSGQRAAGGRGRGQRGGSGEHEQRRGSGEHADSGKSADNDGSAAWRVTPGAVTGAAAVGVGNAGTVLRFVPPTAALTRADVEFRGDDRAAARPVGPLLAALRELGAVIDDQGRGAVPFTVRGRGGIAGGTVTLDASGSSQLVSGLLLSAPRYDKGAEIRHEGPRVPSAPHIEMTVQMLRDAGAQVETGNRGRGAGHRTLVPDLWRVHPGELAPGTIAVEPDLSNAAPFLAAALVTGGSVTIAGWPEQTSQPAPQILEVLTQMGAVCSPAADGMRVTGAGTIRGIRADLRDVSELVPVLAALAALADSPSVLTGIGHMRRHESDRLAALADGISALGGDVTEREDGLEIRPRPLHGDGARWDSHDDHRMVMAAAVLGLALPGGLRVGGAATVGKTFPDFTTRWSAMLECSP